MAVYFPEKSQTYKTKTPKDVYRRREILAAHLKDNYKVTRGRDQEVFDAVKSALDSEGIIWSQSIFSSDKSLLRAAYQYLTAKDVEAREEILQRTRNAASMTNCFIADGITSWSELGYGEASEGAEEDDEPESEPFNLSRCNAGERVVGKVTALLEELEEMVDENARLKEEVGRQAEDLERLKCAQQDLATMNELLESELEQAQQRVEELRGRLRNAQSSAHGEALEAIAEKYPEHPELYRIAQELKRPCVPQDELSELRARLPERFVWPDGTTGTFEYTAHFLKALNVLAFGPQRKIVEQLHTLAKHGPEYASLNTKKNASQLPHTPDDALISRGSDELRFTWRKNGHITVHWLYRRGDSRIRQSER